MHNEKSHGPWKGFRDFENGGGRIRTYDLQVMSLASYLTAPPRGAFNIVANL